MTKWSVTRFNTAIDCLRASTSLDDALLKYNVLLGNNETPVNKAALKDAFRRCKLGPPSSYLQCKPKYTPNCIKDNAARRYKFASISDTHLGSDYTAAHKLTQFIEGCYKEGIRDIFHSGDATEGIYDHAKWEVNDSGFDAQALALHNALPQLDGLLYHLIPGNHDETYFKAAGMDPGRALSDFFKGRGRNDLKAYPMRKAIIQWNGFKIMLKHPTGGGEVTGNINRLWKEISNMAEGSSPHIMIAGHWHNFGHVKHPRGTEIVVAPTFQGMGGPFGNSLSRNPSCGGMVFEFVADEQKRIVEFTLTRKLILLEDQVFNAR